MFHGPADLPHTPDIERRQVVDRRRKGLDVTQPYTLNVRHGTTLLAHHETLSDLQVQVPQQRSVHGDGQGIIQRFFLLITERLVQIAMQCFEDRDLFGRVGLTRLGRLS